MSACWNKPISRSLKWTRILHWRKCTCLEEKTATTTNRAIIETIAGGTLQDGRMGAASEAGSIGNQEYQFEAFDDAVIEIEEIEEIPVEEPQQHAQEADDFGDFQAANMDEKKDSEAHEIDNDADHDFGDF